MKSLGPSFQFYVDDFIGGTQHMSAAEVGAYIRLLCAQWRDENVSTCSRALSRISGLKPSQLKTVLRKFDTGPDGNLRNARMAQIREERIAYIERQSLAGKASAHKRLSTLVQPPFQPPFQPDTQPEGKSPSPSPSPSPSMIEREREALTTGSLAECTKAVLSARPDIRFREMDVANVLQACATDADRLTVTRSFVADLANMIEPPTNPLGYLRGYVRKHHAPEQPRKSRGFPKSSLPD